MADQSPVRRHIPKAVADCGSGHITAMAWAVPEEDSPTVRIIDILSTSEDSRRAVLQLIRANYPDRPITIADTPPDDSSAGTDSACDGTRDRGHTSFRDNGPPATRSLKSLIRVTDPIIAATNAYSGINGDGTVTVEPHDSPHDHLDLDVDISVLCRLIFSSKAIGAITGLPSSRPVMTLMLD